MISLPLNIEKGRFSPVESVRKSIDETIRQIIATPLGACKSDPDYGFSLNTLRFQLINEKEGVVFAKADDNDVDSKLPDYYNKKISGNSKSINTFAAELKDAIAEYEPRLDDVNVSMTYRREERTIYMVIKALIAASKEKYEFNTSLKVWN